MCVCQYSMVWYIYISVMYTYMLKIANDFSSSVRNFRKHFDQTVTHTLCNVKVMVVHLQWLISQWKWRQKYESFKCSWFISFFFSSSHLNGHISFHLYNGTFPIFFSSIFFSLFFVLFKKGEKYERWKKKITKIKNIERENTTKICEKMAKSLKAFHSILFFSSFFFILSILSVLLAYEKKATNSTKKSMCEMCSRSRTHVCRSVFYDTSYIYTQNRQTIKIRIIATERHSKRCVNSKVIIFWYEFNPHWCWYSLAIYYFPFFRFTSYINIPWTHIKHTYK